MRIRVLKSMAFIFITLYFCSGCFMSSKENFNRLPDRKFYFSEFQFSLKGENRESAYNFFNKFPVKKIMFMLAKEHNITIDISDYNNFITAKDMPSIATDGFIRTAKHTWKSKNSENNRITFIFEQDYLDESLQKFKIGIYSGKSSLRIIDIESGKIDSILNHLKLRLDSGQESLKEYEEKNYDIISPVPLIIETKSSSPVIVNPEDII